MHEAQRARRHSSGRQDWPRRSRYDKRHLRYREIYTHSTLLLADDGFMTLGSSNVNQRSMAVDSEINVAPNDPRAARNLRKRVWEQHSAGTVSGKDCSRADIAETFAKRTKLMAANFCEKKGEAMVGFLLPLADNRKSTNRLG